jgi:hypothetical protein
MKYRVWIEQVNQTFVDVDAKTPDEARDNGYRKWRKDEGHSRVIDVKRIEPGER